MDVILIGFDRLSNRGSRWEEGKLNEVASSVDGDVIIKRYRAARGN